METKSPQTGPTALIPRLLLPALAVLAVALLIVGIVRSTRRPAPTTPVPTVGTVVNMQFYYPGATQMQAWYTNQVSQWEEGLWYQWTTNTVLRMYHQYRQPAPLSPCLYDEMSWGDGLWYWATVDTCGPVVRHISYPQGIQYMPRWWIEGTQPRAQGTTEWILYEDGQETERGTYNWACQILGWEWLNPDTRAIHIKVWGKQSWTAPFPTCCMHYEEEWWLGEKDGQTLILRSLGGYRENEYPEWDIWHRGWYPLDQTPAQESP